MSSVEGIPVQVPDRASAVKLLKNVYGNTWGVRAQPQKHKVRVHNENKASAPIIRSETRKKPAHPTCAKCSNCDPKVYWTVDAIKSFARYNITLMPRNGLLLGIVRGGGFLALEKLDMDMAVLYSDIERMKKHTTIQSIGHEDVVYTLGFKGYSNVYRNSLYDGYKPNTREQYEAYSLKIDALRNGKSIRRELGFDNPSFYFPYNRTHVFYPTYRIRGYNMKLTIAEIIRHNKHGAGLIDLETGKRGVKMGAHGTVFNVKDFSKTVEMPFYDTMIDLPHGYASILRQFYGYDWRTPISRVGNTLRPYSGGIAPVKCRD